MTARWTMFDSTAQAGSPFIKRSDRCFYYMTKTQGRPSDSEANQLVYNLKLGNSMSEAQRRAGHRDKAIARCASDMARYLYGHPVLKPGNAILVPVSPYKPRSNPEYDDRMVTVCRMVESEVGIRCVDCLSTIADLGSVHGGSMRREVDDVARNMGIDPSPIPGYVEWAVIVDDVLTKGTHFKAAQSLLLPYVPNTCGLFWARQELAQPEWFR